MDEILTQNKESSIFFTLGSFICIAFVNFSKKISMPKSFQQSGGKCGCCSSYCGSYRPHPHPYCTKFKPGIFRTRLHRSEGRLICQSTNELSVSCARPSVVVISETDQCWISAFQAPVRFIVKTGHNIDRVET